MTHEQKAAAHQQIAATIRSGCPALSVYVADRIVILADPIAAERWREIHGETLAGLPLDVAAAWSLVDKAAS